MNTIMKFIPLLFCVSIFVSSCGEDAEVICEDVVCGDDCMFTLNEQEVEVTFLNCFDRLGFMYSNEQYNIALIPDEIPKDYREEGMVIEICGNTRENTIPLSFPDPNVGEVYQFKTYSIKAK